MPCDKLILGTRASGLALAQAMFVKQELVRVTNGTISVDVKKFVTTGDTFLNKRFQSIGAKGLFTKELDDALLRGEIDFAVHSMKDLPSELPSELKLVCVPEPEDPRDVFVSREGELFDNLPQNAIVGTSSIRRQTIIKHLRPDLKVVEWRGNIETRLRKLENNKSISGIILAHAGLSRLQLNSKISHAFDPDIFVPATGQGMLAIVCKKEDIVVQTILARINNLKAFHFAKLQREFLSLMEGGCTVPVGCFLRERQDGTLAMIGYLANSQKEIKCKVNGTMDQSSDFPLKLFDAMISRGAKTILADFKKD